MSHCEFTSVHKKAAMKKKMLKTVINEYPSEQHLAEEDQKLLLRARKALKKAYAPYSNFSVGAAILLANGKIIEGSNQENASYSICLCAERSALSSAAARYPKTPVMSIAITAKTKNKVLDVPVTPCGACRQYISEVENRYGQPMKIIMQGEIGKVYIAQSGQSLLPLSFDASFL